MNRRLVWPIFAVLILAVSLAFLPVSARQGGCTINWAVDADGFWDEGSNWDTGTPPVFTDHVCIDWPAGDYTITVRTSGRQANNIQSAETLHLTGATTTLRVSAPSTTTHLWLEDGDLTHNSAGHWTISGQSTWSDGRVMAPITNTGALTLTGAAVKELTEHLDNSGTMVHEQGDLLIGSADIIYNRPGARYVVTGDITFNGSGAFRNEGLLRKSGGSGATAFSSNTYLHKAGGTIDVLSGQMTWGRGTSSGGTFNVTPGTTLDLNGGLTSGYPSFSGLYTGSGGGRVQMVSGTINLQSATFNLPGDMLHWQAVSMPTTTTP